MGSGDVSVGLDIIPDGYGRLPPPHSERHAACVLTEPERTVAVVLQFNLMV